MQPAETTESIGLVFSGSASFPQFRGEQFHIYFPETGAIGCEWGLQVGRVVRAGWAHRLGDMLCRDCASRLDTRRSGSA